LSAGLDATLTLDSLFAKARKPEQLALRGAENQKPVPVRVADGLTAPTARV
jgi:hypothetical protein